MQLEEIQSQLSSYHQIVKDKKICVLTGGLSDENRQYLDKANPSTLSITGIRQGLDELDLRYDEIDVALVQDQLQQILEGYDAVFLNLHGEFGEDGCIQGFLEIAKVPYVGTGVLGSAIGLDKVVFKQLLLHHDIPTPKFIILSGDISEDFQSLQTALNESPVVVKPTRGGCSIGIHYIDKNTNVTKRQLASILEQGEYFLEHFVSGRAVTMGVIEVSGNVIALPSVEIITTNHFYDEATKMHNDTNSKVSFRTPADVREETETLIRSYAATIHKWLHCSGMSRIDMVIDECGHPYILEINTLPGISPESNLPEAAKAFGLSHKELMLVILQSIGLEKW